MDILDHYMDLDELELEAFNYENDLIALEAYINDMLTLQQLLDTYDSDSELDTVLKFIDPENKLEELGIFKDASGLEAIQLRVELDMSDLNKVWFMMKPVMTGMISRFKEKENLYKQGSEQYLKIFNRVLDEDDFSNKSISNVLSAQDFDRLTSTLKSLSNTIPKSIIIIKNPGEYNRIIRSFNFNKANQALSIRMGVFVSAGKNKSKNKAFYQKTSFDFTYRKNITMKLAGYSEDMDKCLKTYEEGIGALNDLMSHLVGSLSTYDKDMRGLSMRLSKLPDDARGRKIAGLQLKLVNDLLRMFNSLSGRLDIVYGRLNSLATAIRQVSKKK